MGCFPWFGTLSPLVQGSHGIFGSTFSFRLGFPLMCMAPRTGKQSKIHSGMIFIHSPFVQLHPKPHGLSHAKLSAKHWKLPSLPLLTLLWPLTFSVQVAAADASGWLRNKDTKFKHKNVDFTWILLNFYKAVRLFWKRNRDALISWILMVHHETASPCYPCCATFLGRSQATWTARQAVQPRMQHPSHMAQWLLLH